MTDAITDEFDPAPPPRWEVKPSVVVRIHRDHDLVSAFLKWQGDSGIFPLGVGGYVDGVNGSCVYSFDSVHEGALIQFFAGQTEPEGRGPDAYEQGREP